MLKTATKRLSLLHWLTPLLLIFMPLIVSFFTALPFALNVRTAPDQGPLKLIGSVVPPFSRFSLDYPLISAVLLFLCTFPLVRAKMGHYLVVSLMALFSIPLVVLLWSKLPIINVLSIELSYAHSGGRVHVHSPQIWVYLISAGGTLLLLLNLMTVIGQKKTA